MYALSASDGGGICISSTVYDAVEGKLAFEFDFLGEHVVKNIAKPVRVYCVRAESKPALAHPRAKRRMRWQIAVPALALVLLLLGAAGTWLYRDVWMPAPEGAARRSRSSPSRMAAEMRRAAEAEKSKTSHVIDRESKQRRAARVGRRSYAPAACGAYARPRMAVGPDAGDPNEPWAQRVNPGLTLPVSHGPARGVIGGLRNPLTGAVRVPSPHAALVFGANIPTGGVFPFEMLECRLRFRGAASVQKRNTLHWQPLPQAQGLAREQPLADIRERIRGVRFTFRNRHAHRRHQCLLSANSRHCGPRLIYMSPASPIAPDRGRVAHTLSSPALVYSVCERGISWRGVVHLDANCHPGRARADNVVARNRRLTRFGSSVLQSVGSCGTHSRMSE
jgi:hypothetical protein